MNGEARRFDYGIILLLIAAAVVVFIFNVVFFYFYPTQKSRIFHMGNFIHTHTWVNMYVCACVRVFNV